MRRKRPSIGLSATLTIFAVTLFVTSADAASEKVLYSFKNNGKDGVASYAGLTADSAGNLYGTTLYGGALGFGSVFELTPKTGGGWTETVLYSFTDSEPDGAEPYSDLVRDAAGNLYGTTLGGGEGYGTVFELKPKSGGGWTEKTLHTFLNDGNDGFYPYSGLIFDTAGNLYGTTSYGGKQGSGTVFELAPRSGGGWTETRLYDFDNNGTDGVNPYGGLVFDPAGNLYGTTGVGGPSFAGTVFELTFAAGAWAETVLYSFSGEDGFEPLTSLTVDTAGNLYGTTEYGGIYGYGTVFELHPAGGGWTQTVLHDFNYNFTDGCFPSAGLIFDTAGNLYGTTLEGGADGYGTVFELEPKAGGAWTEKILHSFNDNGKDGYYSYAGVILNAGDLYGTTSSGGSHSDGTVVAITP